MHLLCRKTTDHDDNIVFVARSSFILRGTSSLIGKQTRTATRWSSFAKQVLDSAEAKERCTDSLSVDLQQTNKTVIKA